MAPERGTRGVVQALRLHLSVEYGPASARYFDPSFPRVRVDPPEVQHARLKAAVERMNRGARHLMEITPKTEGEPFRYDADVDGIALVCTAHPHSALRVWSGESPLQRLRLVLKELDIAAAGDFWFEISGNDARELATLIRAALA